MRKSLSSRCHCLGRSLARVLRDRQIQGQVIGDGPLAQIVFSPDPVDDYRSTARGDKEMGRRVMLDLFEGGVFLNPMGTKLYLSIVHDEGACDEFCRRLDTVLGKL